MKKNGNRILTYALVLSLAVHLLFAAVFRPIKSVEAKPEQPPQQFHIDVIHTPPPPTPAPTKPPETKPQKPQPQPHQPSITPPKTGANDPNGPTMVAASPGPPGDGPRESPAPSTPPSSPEPTLTPKPACSVPNAPASTISVVSPTLPDGVDNVGKAEAQVRVTLEPSGAIEGVQIYRTAGNPLLDREALRAARQSTYRAEIRDCVSVRGDYLFTVDFTE